MKARPAGVIFDRDGVLNLDLGYVGTAERFHWVDGARAAIARLNRAQVKVIVATNQSGVARGFFTEADVEALHGVMRRDLAEVGAWVDAIYMCPFLPDAPVERFAHPDHPDRKPRPGMVLRALADHDLDPVRTVLIGDKPSDLEAAAAAGIAGLLFSGSDLDRFICESAAARYWKQ